MLGDKISIMARGNIRAIGTSIRLKQKFGAGTEFDWYLSLLCAELWRGFLYGFFPPLILVFLLK